MNSAVSILIVEDEDDVRSLMRTVLQRGDSGLNVVGEAVDGAEGLERWSELRPEIVVADQRMPRMDGMTMIGEIRRRAPEQKIVLCSAYLTDDLLRDAEAMDVVCLRKGQVMELPDTVHELVRRS